MATTKTLMKIDPLLEHALQGRDYSGLTWDMLWTLCDEWVFTYRHDNDSDVDAVTTTRAVRQALDTGTCDLGAEFAERVHEAMGYTPSPWDSMHDSDYDR